MRVVADSQVAGSFAIFPLLLHLHSSVYSGMHAESVNGQQASTLEGTKPKKMPQGRGSQTYLFFMHLNSAKNFNAGSETLFTEKYAWAWMAITLRAVLCLFLFLAGFFLLYVMR